jgi:hypothetical protein
MVYVRIGLGVMDENRSDALALNGLLSIRRIDYVQNQTIVFTNHPIPKYLVMTFLVFIRVL